MSPVHAQGLQSLFESSQLHFKNWRRLVLEADTASSILLIEVWKPEIFSTCQKSGIGAGFHPKNMKNHAMAVVLKHHALA